MSGITIMSGDRSLEQRFMEVYGRQLPIRRAWSNQWRDPSEAALDACAADPELLVIGSDVPYHAAREIVASVDRTHGSTTVVALVDVIDVDAVMELMRLGARDVLLNQPDSPEFRGRLDPIIDLARERHRSVGQPTTTSRRRVISVLSPKGGTGKTTVASNLAVGLAKRMPKQVLLLDLDLQFGDCATSLGVKPEHSLQDAIAAADHERSTMKVFLTSHPSGLAMLAPPSDLAAVDGIDGDDLKRTVSALAEEFPFVVVDTAAGIDASALSAMELSTDLLFVTSPAIPSILAVQRQLEVLDRIGFTSQTRTLVLNRANVKLGLSVADVEASLGLEAQFRIPESKLLPQSVNEGSPVVERDGGGLARKFEEIALHYAPDRDESVGRSLLRPLRKERSS